MLGRQSLRYALNSTISIKVHWRQPHRDLRMLQVAHLTDPVYFFPPAEIIKENSTFDLRQIRITISFAKLDKKNNVQNLICIRFIVNLPFQI